MKMETSLFLIRESTLVREKQNKTNHSDLKYRTSVIEMGSASN